MRFVVLFICWGRLSSSMMFIEPLQIWTFRFAFNFSQRMYFYTYLTIEF